MNKQSVFFCSGSVLVSLLVFALAFPYASLPQNTLADSQVPAFAEDVADVDMGDFGKVSVSELVAYYIENAPEPVVQGAAPKRAEHFGGC